MYLSEDSFRLRSQAYSYFADTFTKALRAAATVHACGCPTTRVTATPRPNDIAKGDTLERPVRDDPARRALRRPRS